MTTSGLEKGLYVYRYSCKDLQDAIESRDAYQIGQEAKLSDGTANGIQRILDVMLVTMDALSAISGVDWVVCWFDGEDKQGVVSMTLRQGDLVEAEKQACKQETPPGLYWREVGVFAPSAKEQRKWTQLDGYLAHSIDSADAIKTLLRRWNEHVSVLLDFDSRLIFWFDGEREWSMKELAEKESAIRRFQPIAQTVKTMKLYKIPELQSPDPFVSKLHGMNASVIFNTVFFNMVLPKGCEMIEADDLDWALKGSQLECRRFFKVQKNVSGKRVEDKGSLYMTFDLIQGKVETVKLSILGEKHDIQVGEVVIERELLAQTFGPMAV
ncbi:hypothetical protein D3C87_820710 [compost metagenome]